MRFAVHKLLVAQRRDTADKKKKTFARRKN
jgi:hypothetical protein